MRRRNSRFVVVLSTAALLLILGTPAHAEHLEISVVGPEEVTVGDTVKLQVVVQSAESRERVQGATVAATRRTEIAGFSGQVEVAKAVTDQDGLAQLSWVERGGVTETVVVAYSAPGENDFESKPLSVYTVSPGPQLERSESGVEIPGLGAWVLIGVLVGIWAIIQFALVGPVQVARLGAAPDEPLPSPEPEGSA